MLAGLSQNSKGKFLEDSYVSEEGSEEVPDVPLS